MDRNPTDLNYYLYLIILNKESVNSPSQHFVHSHRTLRKYDLSRREASKRRG